MLLFLVHLETSTLTFWPVAFWKWLCCVNVVYRWSVEKRSCNMMQVSWFDVWLSQKDLSLPKECCASCCSRSWRKAELLPCCCRMWFDLFTHQCQMKLHQNQVTASWTVAQERHWTNHQTAFSLFQALHTHTYTFVHVCVPACVCVLNSILLLRLKHSTAEFVFHVFSLK